MKTLLSLSLGIALATAVLSAQTTVTAPAHDPRIGQLLNALGQVKAIRQTALSPDGQYLSWIVAARSGSAIELAPLSNPAAARHLTACSAGESGAESDVAFSPDSKQLAFFSDCTPDRRTAIFLADSSGAGLPHQLVELNGVAQDLAWAPDGKHLSFLYVEGATRRPSPLAAEKPPAGVIGVEGLEIRRVASVDPATGTLSEITPPNLYV